MVHLDERRRLHVGHLTRKPALADGETRSSSLIAWAISRYEPARSVRPRSLPVKRRRLTPRRPRIEKRPISRGTSGVRPMWACGARVPPSRVGAGRSPGRRGLVTRNSTFADRDRRNLIDVPARPVRVIAGPCFAALKLAGEMVRPVRAGGRRSGGPDGRGGTGGPEGGGAEGPGAGTVPPPGGCSGPSGGHQGPFVCEGGQD